MPFICPICGNAYMSWIPCPYCIKVREEKQTDSIPLEKKIKEAMKDKKENDDEGK